MSRLAELDLFYRERVPTQFNRTLTRQEAAAAGDPEQARILDEMRAVRTGIEVRVTLLDPAAEERSYALEIEKGVMRCTPALARPPFMSLRHSLEQFEALRLECGDSILGFLGGLAGLGDEMRLTAGRVRSLRELAGALVFELRGPSGFALTASFGDTPDDPKPRSHIRLDEPVFARLRGGELDPQEAFLEGLVEVEGDMEMAIRLALAALSPD